IQRQAVSPQFTATADRQQYLEQIGMPVLRDQPIVQDAARWNSLYMQEVQASFLVCLAIQEKSWYIINHLIEIPVAHRLARQ
ncbi:MAG: hypothetical protein VW600_12575, partial [Ferrovibrio sp.]